MRSNRLQARTIRQKLWLSFGIIFLGLIVLGALFFVMTGLQRRAFDNAVQAALIADEIEIVGIEMLEARRREKDFLLRYQNAGYSPAFQEYIVPQQEHVQNALAAIDVVSGQTLIIEGAVQIQQALDEAYPTISQYGELSFHVLDDDIRARTDMVTTMIERNEVMHSEAERLENVIVHSALHDLEVVLLVYLQRTQPGHTTVAEFSGLQADAIAGVNAELDELREVLRTVNVTDESRDLMISAFDEVRVLFQQVNVIDVEIASEIEEFRSTAHEIEPIVENLLVLTDEALEDAGAAVETTTTIAYASQLIAIAATFVLALLATGSLARSLIQRVEALTASAHRMSEGDYAQRADVSDADEIGQLAGAFNTMVSAVEERSTALTDLNTSLEQRIYDRTRELEVATREAREASRLKDEFLAIMSHELRTPLNAIIGYQGIMMMASELEEEDMYRVERTRSNAQRLLNLIDDILNISRIESGRLQIVPTPVDLRALTGTLQGQMDVLAAEKKLEFTVDVADSVPTTILTDEDAITKIITNLLSNAFKFTDTGEVSLRIHADGLACQIEVRDTGEGIPAHMHEVIFERFRQVDGSTKRKVGGTGLGLAIVQQLAKAMNGSVSVLSELKQGTTFVVTLPLLPTPIPEQTPLEETHA